MISNGFQRTLAREISFSGVGLHTGAKCTMKLCPNKEGTGIQLRSRNFTFPATIDCWHSSNRCTSLSGNGEVIYTVEHLLAALYGMEIDNCLVEITGGEAPILDGSALPIVEAIQSVGTIQQHNLRPVLSLTKPIWLQDGDSQLIVSPSTEMGLTCGIHFDHPAIGRQLFCSNVTEEVFAREIAPARTFGFLQEVEELRSRGLALGGAIENAVVIGDNGYLSPLRFHDECVRHKALDLVGDIALLGARIQAHIIALKTSHKLNVLLVKSIREREETN